MCYLSARFIPAQPETLLMMALPWVAASGGVGVRKLFPKLAEAQHAQILTKLGYPPDRAAAIAAEKDPLKQRALQAEEWAKIPDEVKRQIIRDADARNIAAKRTGQFTEAPSILKFTGKDAEGQPQDVYHVLHEDGSLAYPTSSLEAAHKVHEGLLLSFAKNKQTDPPRASWDEVRKGDRWAFVKKLMPKDSVPFPTLDTASSPEKTYEKIKDILLKEPLVTDPWGNRILIANPEGKGPDGIEQRAKHLAAPREKVIGSGERVFDEHKAKGAAAIAETIHNAQARVGQGSEILYFRRYSNGLIHMVVVDSHRGTSSHGDYDGGVLSQYTPKPDQRFEGAKMLETRTLPPAPVQDGAVVGNNPKAETQESTQAATPPESQTQLPSSESESQGVKAGREGPSGDNIFTLPRLQEGDSTGTEAAHVFQFKDVADVSPELRTRVEAVAQGMRQNPGTAGADSHIKVKELVESPHHLESRASASLFIRSFEKLTGKKVVFIDTAEHEPAPFSGVVNQNFPDTIFLHVRGNRNVLALVGHEWIHTLSQQDPALFRTLQNQLVPLLDSWKDRSKELRWFYPRRDVSEELTANIVGDAFIHPDFWKHLSEQNRPLFERLVESIKRWFASFQGKAHESEWGTEAAFKDIEAVHKAVMSTLEEASRRGLYPEPASSTQKP